MGRRSTWQWTMEQRRCSSRARRVTNRSRISSSRQRDTTAARAWAAARVSLADVDGATPLLATSPFCAPQPLVRRNLLCLPTFFRTFVHCGSFSNHEHHSCNESTKQVLSLNILARGISSHAGHFDAPGFREERHEDACTRLAPRSLGDPAIRRVASSGSGYDVPQLACHHQHRPHLQ